MRIVLKNVIFFFRFISSWLHKVEKYVWTKCSLQKNVVANVFSHLHDWRKHYLTFLTRSSLNVETCLFVHCLQMKHKLVFVSNGVFFVQVLKNECRSRSKVVGVRIIRSCVSSHVSGVFFNMRFCRWKKTWRWSFEINVIADYRSTYLGWL